MLLKKLNKTINQFTLYYQSIVSICFQYKDVFVVELKKTLCEISIIKTNKYENMELPITNNFKG